MQSTEEVVRASAPHGQPDVTISLEELLCELEKESQPLPLVDLCDLTRKVYADRYGLSVNAAGDRLDALVKRGKLIRINKRAANGATVATYHKAGS